MTFQCPFCLRTFSTRNACSQHRNYCMLLAVDQSSSEESELITDVNDMSLGSEDFSNVDEVKH